VDIEQAQPMAPGITPRLAGSGPPVYRYYAWSAARPLRPLWLFARSGVRPGVPIPGIVGYELDQKAGTAR
jgi:hypothetical protein